MCETKSTTFDIMTMKKHTYLDELKKSAPRLKGTVPNFGLPKWKRLPLESKIPMIPGLSETVYAFARRKLGESLRVRFSQRKPFDMSDPYNYEVPLPYEGMHDKHLTQYFRNNESVRKQMIKTGLITPKLDVKCSLKDYNNYRNYLRVMYAKLITEELDKRDSILREKMLLNMAEIQTEKKNERLKKEDIRDKLVQKIKEEREYKLEKILIKDKKNDERVETMKEMKHQMNEKKKAEAQKKHDVIKQKRAIMTKREEQKILNTLNKWHERDCLLRKTKEQNLLKKENDKLTSFSNRFEQKKNIQEEDLQKEIFANECIGKLKNIFLRRYQKKLEKSQRKLKALLYFKKQALQKSLRRKYKKKAVKGFICQCKKH